MANKWVCLDTNEIKYLRERLASVGDSYSTVLAKKLEKQSKRITVASAKQKGYGFQYWVCERLSGLLGIPWVQADDQSLIQSRPGAQHGSDIILRGEAYLKFPFDIECKSTENMNIVSTVEQAKANTKGDRDWLIFHRKKALPEPVVIMAWSAFEKLYRRILNGK